MTLVIRKITIQRNQHGLGFVLSGQNPCVVSSITQDGPADLATLRTGDEILEVDFMNVAHLKHDEVVRHILRDTTGKVIINVRTFVAVNHILNSGHIQTSLQGHSAKAVKNDSDGLLSNTKTNYLQRYDKCANSTFYNNMEISDEFLLNNQKKFSSLSKRRVINDNNVMISCDGCPSNYLPGIFGIKSQKVNESKHSVQCNDDSKLNRTGNFPQQHVYNAVVSYKCSKEIPKVTNLQASSLETLKSCVLSLKKKPSNASTLILLTINEKGVSMSNPLGKEIITYPLKTITFSAVCADDRNYFGLVTKNVVSNTHSTGLTLPQHSPLNGYSPLSFCHVFMIDPTLCSHEIHHAVASLFNFTCTLSSRACESPQFPKSSSDILKELNSFYDERKFKSFKETAKKADELESDEVLPSNGSKLFKEECTPKYIEQKRKRLVLSPAVNSSLGKDRTDSASDRTLRDVGKLMISPPSSLGGINDKEREEILKELQSSDNKLSNKDESLLTRVEDAGIEEIPPKGKLVRRKSAPEVEQISHKTDTIKRTLFSNQFTQSLKFDSRKPPVPSRNALASGSATDPSFFKNGLGFLTGFRRNFRKKSETTLRRNNLLESTKYGKCDTPQLQYSGSRCDTNEKVKRLSLNSTSSELSLNDVHSKVEGWAQSFERLLSDPIGVRCFQEFLKKEFSEENVLFWVQCEKYKRTKDVQMMKSLAHDIFKFYLSPNAPNLVNVNQNAVKNVEENLHTPQCEMFTKAQDQVYNLMKFDSYNRFLKSDIYKECATAENSGKMFPFEDDIDEEFRHKPMWGKKRPSGNESSLDWRKNLVNFLGKGGKFEKNDDGERLSKVGTSSYEPFDEKNILASPDAVPDGDALQLWDGLHTNTKGNFLRVLLPDGTSTVVVGESGKSLKDTLQDICKKKNITLSTFDVTIGGNKEVASLNMDISTLSDTVICLERRILFRFDLPNGRSVGVKANPSKTLAAILQPVMRKNGFELHHYSVHIMNSKSALPLHSSISIAENKRLVARVLHKKLEKQTSDSAAMKQGSDIRSSFRRFRTNSFKEEKLRTEKQSSEKHSDVQRIHSNEKVKHSLLGRTKSNDEDGASALMSVLQRSQSGRLDDQRGTLIHDLEMPEFLKVTYSTPLVTRSKPLSTSADSSPMHGKYAGSYPASPVIVDRRMMNLPFDEQMESRLNSSMNSGFYSVTSWKEVESPDREIIDNTFASDACFDTVGDKNIITDNRAYLLELSKSHPSLQQENTKQRLCKENSAPTTQQTASINNEDHNVDIRRTPKFPLPNDLHSSSRMIFQRPIALENTEFSVKSPPCTKPKTLSTPPMSQKLDISKKTETSMRPKSITNYSEKEVLMGLEKDGYEIICTNDTRKGNKSLVPSSQQEAANYSTNESSGMISLPDMNSPPNGTQNTSGYMMDKDSVFQVNAVPTPDKGRLLNGETVLSRKNEKITFV